MTEVQNELEKLLEENRLIPFVGAGFSKNCGCPSWRELIDVLLEKFNIDKSFIEEDADLSRIAEYIRITNNGRTDEIIEQIETVFRERITDVSKSRAHLYLAKLGVPIIYTTNYDQLIEKAYEFLCLPYTKIATTSDMVKGNGSLPQIVKFHGCLGCKSSIILTESDLFRRLEFETPIDIKLRYDMLGKGLLIMGYSFHDFNIRYLWFKLRKMRKEIKSEEVPKSYMLVSRPNPMTKAMLHDVEITPILLTDFPGNTTEERLCAFLQSLVRR